ncbi:MAG: amidohydrolase family protein [Oscillospiraceae bacterium]|nr:amidohydrolase family protein [Oscillospiraceae bacterium]
MLKIDVFAHITTTEYLKKFTQTAPEISKRSEAYRRSMTDYDIRENLMRRHPDVLQIITMGNLPLERYVSAKDAVELARIGNEELAELVIRKPGLYYGAAGVVPLDDIKAGVEITEHCLRDLHMLGIQLFTSLETPSLADPKYRPVFAKAAEYDRAVWIHPASMTEMNPDRGMFSWPYDSARFMFEMVKSGIYDEFPDIKIIIHHAGGMAAFFRGRIMTLMGARAEEQFKNFYVDTALYGNTPALMLAYDFFGARHMLFGTDAPMGAPWGGNGDTDSTILAVDKMPIPEEERELIYRGNATRLFGILT